MFRLLLIYIMILSASQSIDFNTLKEDTLAYIDSLDHPNKETGNKFSKNLAIAKEAKNTHITIYSVGLAMVTEEKNVSITMPGNVKIMYADVPSKVDLSSVSMHFDKNVTLYSQKYAYDIVNFSSLLRRYLGKYILYINDKTDKKQKKATLLATDPIIVKDLKSGNIFTPFKVFFENIPEDMAVTPTLFWDIYTKAKALNIKLEYLTDAITWKSDYNLYLKSDYQLDLNSWITIANNSGARYKDANITIVTGTVNRIASHNDVNVSKKIEKRSIVKKEDKDRSDYSLYTIPHTENLRNKEEKQISFIRGERVEYEEYLLNDKVYDFQEHNLTSLHFAKVLAFENSEENHLGRALPQGIVRIYKYDTLSSKRFIGAAKIANIKENDKVELDIGKSREIVGEEKMLVSKQSGLKAHIAYMIKMKNSSQQSRVIKLKRSIPDKVGEVLMKDSCHKQCKKEKLSALSMLYHITLEPEQIYELKIEYFINSKADMQKEDQ